MLVPSDTGSATPDLPPPDLVEIGAYPTAPAAFERGLVILAMGGAYWLVSAEAGHRLFVESTHAAAARRQLDCFERESVAWPPRYAEPVPAAPLDFATPMLWWLATAGVFWLEALHPTWVRTLELDSSAVWDRHEWWRVGSALFLHADIAHLVANGLTGIFVFASVISTMGRARAWLGLAVAAVLGNLACVAVYADLPYRSLGASTAVFAGLGLLTGQALRRVRASPRQSLWRALLPLAAGAIVLALFGTAGERTDVPAHVAGFAAGVLAGILISPRLPGTRRT